MTTNNKEINPRIIKSTIKNNIKIKKRAYLFQTIMQPLTTAVFTILGAYFMYAYLFNGQVSDTFESYANTADYMSYIMIGSIIFILTVAMITAVNRNFIMEMRSGTFESIFITKMTIPSYLIANLLEIMILSLFETILLILIALPFGLNIQQFDIFALIIGLGLTLFSLYSMSIFVWGLMVYFQDTMNTLNVFILLINLLSGIVFPIQYLPTAIQTISHLIPTTYSVNILRSTLLSGANIQSQVGNFIMLFILTVVYCCIATFIANKILKKQLNESLI